MLLSFSTAIALLYASAVAATGLHTIQMNVHPNPGRRNADSITKRYLHKRGISSTNPLTSVAGDIMYTVPLGLGTPSQQFNLAIDTGSPITWVVANSCFSRVCSKVSNHFSCDQSSSCEQSITPFNISYVDGSMVAGSYISEQYTLSSLSFKGTVGLVTNDESALASTVDGIMGLWYYPPGSQVPILNVLKNSTALAQPQIGIWLKGSNTERNAPGGEITFGGADSQRYTGDVTYVDCTSETPWTIPVGGMSVNGKVIPSSGTLATLDTGTSLMLFSQNVSDAINSAIPGAIKDPKNGWFLPCQGDYPITITFGGRKITIPYTALAVQNQAAQTNDGATVCLSAAMYPTGDTAPVSDWLLGDAFLKNVYTIYDFSTAKGRIGLASLANNSNDVNNGNNVNNNAAVSKKDASNALKVLSLAVGIMAALI
ncbi:hypothetical protein FBU30_003130 [Linnemannia zychae]|nr:hypothetical protein FBU30_003130 [Linnemannia zychae]